MPTLDQWQQALATPRRFHVESSPSLLQEIQLRHAKRDAERLQLGQPIPPRKATLAEVAAFAPERELQVAPAFLLHRLGVVTTPAVENLADICSYWAYLRYLWAFDIPPPGSAQPALRLARAARDIDFHQKALLSDQIGVGMAAVLLGTYLHAPLAADVSVALGDDNWPIHLQHDASPDYLFFDAQQSSVYVVECKGTQTSRSTSLDQLRRGTEQVLSLAFADGRTPPSLVVATCLSKSGTRVLVVDPPGDKDPPTERVEKLEQKTRLELKVRSDPNFATSARLVSEAKILSFAGADEAAASKLERARAPKGRTPPITPRETQTVENEFGRFQGVRHRVGLRDSLDIEVFQAVDTAVRDALLSEDTARTAEKLRAFQAKIAAVSGSGELMQAVLTRRETGLLVVTSAGPDGSLLEVRVAER